MIDIFLLIERVYNTHKDEITDSDILSALTEELGEYSRAVRVENKSVICAHKTINESSRVEAIDIMLVAIEAYIARGGTYLQFLEIATTKLNKWQQLWESERENR